MKVKLGELTKIRTGKLDANAASENGKYPFFTCSKEPLRISTYSYDCECVLVAGNGDLNVKYYNGKFDAYQRTYIIESNGDGRLHLPYLYYFMTRYIQELRKLSIGGVIKYIKLGNLTDAEISLPSIKEQKDACEKLKKVKDIIDKKEAQISYLDNLIKARFVEMFKEKYDSFKVDEKLKTTSGGTPKSSVSEYYDGGDIPWLTSGEVNYGDITKSSNYITEKGLNNSSAKWVPENSIVIAMYGATAGKVGIVRYKTTTNQAVCSVLPNDNFNQEFLRYAFQDISEELTSKAIGGGQPNISQTIIKNSYIVDAPIEEQERFASFAKQVDKSKFVLSNELTMCDFHIRLIHDRVMHSCINLRVAQ